MTGLVAVSAAIWLGLLLAWGRFWRADQRLGPASADAPAPEIVAVIPARNEVGTITAVIEGHLASDYPGRFSVVLVDDNSDDGTAEAARAVTPEEPEGRALHIVSAPPLEQGWTGKLWALHHGVAASVRLAPGARYLLLTDADIVHAPGTLHALVAKAEAEGRDLVSLMARLDARGRWGRLLIPAFVFFFQKLYPFPKVNERNSRIAGAAGGCVLIRQDALEGIGGVAALRSALIDDCTLARLVKAGPPKRAIWLGLADQEVVSLRDNRDLGSIWTMVARTAFAQLRHSWWLLAGCVAGMALTYLAAPIGLAVGLWRGDLPMALFGAAAWGLMAFAYWPTLRIYGQPWWWALSLPAAAALYTAMTIASAWAHAVGRGGAWKGRTYPAS
ncbi:MAG: glycosyltransferase [Pseudomonadota bacterium]